MFRNAFILLGLTIVITGFGCGSNAPSNIDVKANSNANTAREIKLDPANMPAGLSAIPIPPSANMPPGISMNAVNMPIGNKPIPGIPTAEQLKKGFKPTGPIPGIPDQETIRRQLNTPISNPSNSVPMMKSKRSLGGKP